MNNCVSTNNGDHVADIIGVEKYFSAFGNRPYLSTERAGTVFLDRPSYFGACLRKRTDAPPDLGHAFGSLQIYPLIWGVPSEAYGYTFQCWGVPSEVYGFTFLCWGVPSETYGYTP